MSKKIKIENLTNGQVSIKVPEAHLNRVWERKGAIKTVDKDALEEAMYDPGVEYMFAQGMLRILDVDDEEMEEIAPEAMDVVFLSDDEMRDLLVKASFGKFKDTVSTLKKEQLFNLVDYAVMKEIIDINKSEYLKELTGTDIMRAIQNKRAEEEEVKTEE